MAWDLSCPNPLRNRNRNENPSQQLPALNDKANNKENCSDGLHALLHVYRRVLVLGI